MELNESGSESDGDDDVVGSTRELVSAENSSMLGLEEEDKEVEDEDEEDKDEEDKDEDNMDNFIDPGGFELDAKNDIRGWKELRDQIKSDMNEAHKRHETLTRMNKFLILRNFATLCIKGVKRITASQEIA